MDKKPDFDCITNSSTSQIEYFQDESQEFEKENFGFRKVQLTNSEPSSS